MFSSIKTSATAPTTTPHPPRKSPPTHTRPMSLEITPTSTPPATANPAKKQGVAGPDRRLGTLPQKVVGSHSALGKFPQWSAGSNTWPGTPPQRVVGSNRWLGTLPQWVVGSSKWPGTPPQWVVGSNRGLGTRPQRVVEPLFPHFPSPTPPAPSGHDPYIKITHPSPVIQTLN